MLALLLLGSGRGFTIAGASSFGEMDYDWERRSSELRLLTAVPRRREGLYLADNNAIGCLCRARTLVQLDVLEPACLFACVAPEMERLAGVKA